MSASPASTVVIVTWRGAEHLAECLDALANQTRPHRTLVVDNASIDGTDRVIARHSSAPFVVRLRRNRGYAGGIDAALPHVDTEFIAWLNDDAVPAPTWLAELEDSLGDGVAAVGSRMEYPDGSVQSLGVRLTPHGFGADVLLPAEAPSNTADVLPSTTAGHPHPRQEAPNGTAGVADGTETTAEDNKDNARSQDFPPFAFCGGAALMRTDALRAIGGVPARFFCYYEDTDTAWRFRLAGWDIRLCDRAVVWHRHGVSTRPGSRRFHRWNERNRLLMLLRCAPSGIVARELLRFATLTAILALRRRKPNAPNFLLSLRLRVIADLLLLLPATLAQRRKITLSAVLGRTSLWRNWAGR